jgi:response regulator RpfG family c-di-GMP phosphodiesterase
MAKVLVVDDEKTIRTIFSAFLGAAGYEVDAAADAEAAETLFRTKEFDVVLSDILLPGLNGVALLEKIKAAAPRTQVIMMTGKPTAETAAESLRDGAVDYLFKPCSKEAILHSVGTACRIKTLNDEKERLEAENVRYRQRMEELVIDRTAALQERESRLARVMDASVQAISSAAQLRDPYTAGHERRVACLAAAIARRLGMSEKQERGIEITGFLHDIGKIACPAEILSKPSKLSDSEFGLIKAHPQIGYEILRKIDFLGPVAETTLQHHERLNGAGYPNGLKGSEIILEARILAVADVVEAMSSPRPYRPAMTLELVIQQITRDRDTLFDANAVDACCDVIRSENFRFA